MEFHTIKSLTTEDDLIIKVEFTNGNNKHYDIKKLIKKYKKYKNLENIELFKKGKVDIGGYGIVWNEDLDLSSEEIWNNGY